MKLIDRIKLAYNFIFKYKTKEETFDKIYKHNRVYMCYRCNKKQVSQWNSLCDRCFDAAHGY